MNQPLFLQSPLNYIGGKWGLLPQLLPLFPPCPHRMVDLFAGGLNVGLNVQADEIVCNDRCIQLIDMYLYFQRTPEEELLAAIHHMIASYGLTKENKEAYLQLREDYNQSHRPLLLFLLICYGYNHQIRFNAAGGFNNPSGAGRSSFNAHIEQRLLAMLPVLPRLQFSSLDFRAFDYAVLQAGDFLYADPPYLITCASYNERRRGTPGWTEAEDQALFAILDDLDRRGVKFALSNVAHHKGMTNQPLIDWSAQYYVHPLVKDYSHASYNTTKSETIEVLVTNY